MTCDIKYAVDGRFLLQEPVGVSRYASEIMAGIDKLLDEKTCHFTMTVVVPIGSMGKHCLSCKYRNIKIEEYGKHEDRKWLHIDFASYLVKNKFEGICLCNEVPMRGKLGLVCVHDIAFRTHPEFFTNSGDWHEKIYRRIMYRHAFAKAANLVTVSEFSKNEILENYKVKTEINIAGNGWQHFKNEAIDESVFDKYPEIKKGQYYYYLASLAPNKNLKWIVENAERNPEETFVISGKMLGDDSEAEKLSNIICTGFVTDEQAMAFMKNCRAFVFPSRYEGFGIPPMEALYMGAPIVLGNIESLREIYGDAAIYVDCDNADCDIEKLLKNINVADPLSVLDKYSWEKSAETIYELLEKTSEDNDAYSC